MYAKLAGALFILTMAGVLPTHADQTAYDCTIRINQEHWDFRTCTAEVEGNTLTVKWPGADKANYYARLERSGDQANASWSTTRGGSTDTEALGRLKTDGYCWSNDKAEICFTLDTPAVVKDGIYDLYEDYGSDGEEAGAASIGNASSFRGIQLGMTKAQIEAALNDEFRLSNKLPPLAGDPQSDNGIYDMNLVVTVMEFAIPNGAHFGSQYILNRDNKVCGEMSFADSRVDKIRLLQCYFDIQGRIKIEDFARQIIDTYGLEDGMEYSATTINSGNGLVGYAQYTGLKRAASERFTAAVNELTNIPTLTIEKIPSINFN